MYPFQMKNVLTIVNIGLSYIKMNGLQKVCPKCKSPYWDKPRSKMSEAALKAWETRRKKKK